MKSWHENSIIGVGIVVFVIVATMLAGCSSMQAPTVLAIANDPVTAEQKAITDKVIFQFSDTLRAWWGNRSTKVEAVGTGTLIALDALTTAALAASGGGFGGSDLPLGLIAGVDFIKSLFQRIDPRTRDNAYNSGSAIVLAAQGEYLICITQKRSAVPSATNVSPCGAKFMAKINSAVATVGSLMVGLLPSKEDLDNVTKPVTAVMEEK